MVDGSDYRILYQNLLPNFTFIWADAPSGKYKLHVRHKGKTKVFNTSSASHRLNSGTLEEGSHRVWFEGNGTRSKEGVVTIAFDNAATSGYLRKPRVGSAWGGGQLNVQGAGIKGSRVTVHGVPLPLDRQHRFDASVEKPGSDAAIAIRFSHPKRGVHYYVRRNGRR